MHRRMRLAGMCALALTAGELLAAPLEVPVYRIERDKKVLLLLPVASYRTLAHPPDLVVPDLVTAVPDIVGHAQGG